MRPGHHAKGIAMTKTHFGYEQVDETSKAGKVREVFRSVAPSYDVMNDLMSAGMHRLWKRFTVNLAAVRPGQRVLDVASGSGDLAKAFAELAGPQGQVWQTDINAAMLGVGRDRLVNAGLLLPALQCDAEKLPFPDDYFDLTTVAFGLRNMTHKDRALAEMTRVLKPGGKLIVLEFSKVAAPHASGSGNAEDHDAGRGLGTRRVFQPRRRRRRRAQRLQTINRRGRFHERREK
jgi:demethylmenaquinone methyltransferase/2-methoxy-6-polyprenyl-1,4-benzoquinol methylase